MIEVVHIVARVSTDMTRFNAGMASMEARAKTATAKMSLAGMRMTKYLTLPIAGIAYAGIKSATSFQKSMTLIQTQAGASAKDIPKIAKAIQGMSGRSVMQAPVDLANAYYHLQSVFGNTTKGADTVAKKIKILSGVAHLAQIGGSDMESTASAVAGILRTNLKGAHSVEQVIRTINGIVGSGNMRMPQFVESTGTAVLQVARLLGMSLKEVGAAEAVFTDENMNANMSMTRLRTSLMMAVNPSDAARKKMVALGISSLKIGTLMRGPKGFASTLNYLSTAYDNFVKKLESQGKSAAAAKTIAGGLLFGSFGGSKGASVWATLVQQHLMYHQKEVQIGAKEKSFNKDLAASNKTLSVQFEKAWARIQVALQKFGLAIAPVVLGALHGLVRLADAFTGLPTPIQHFIAAVGVGLAVLGPLLIMTSSIIKIFGDLGTMLDMGGEASLGLGTFLPLAIIAAVGALAYFAYKSKTFRDWLKSWGKEVAGFLKWLAVDVAEKWGKRFYHFFADGGKASRWNLIVIPALKAAAHAFKTFGGAIWTILKKLKDMIYAVIGAFKDWMHYGTVAGNFAEKVANKLGLSGQGSFTPGLRTFDTKKVMAEARARVARERAAERFHNRSTHGGHPRDGAPLVHVGEMHVRHESDAEIVAGKIARKVMIP